MMDRGAAPSAEALLEHAGFLRGLARRLVFDEGQAEDVVQDALAVALRRRPRDPSRLRGWLAGITRNLALKRRRTERRRAQREQVAARPEAQAATGDIVARLDLHRHVVGEVRRLEEPYRTTIVRRFFDGETPRTIAGRMGVPQKTVETRLRRGVQRLRLRLDAAHGGDRRAWCLGLVALVPLNETLPAAATGGTAVVVSGVVMSAKVTVVLTAAVVASFFVGWVVKPEPRQTPPGVRAGGQGGVVAKTSYDELKQELEAERQKCKSLKDRLKALETRPAEPEPKEEAAAKPEQAARKGPRYVFEEYREFMTGLDWKLMAQALHAMPPLLGELADAVENGKPIPPSVGDIQRWNGPLLKEALKLHQRGLPGMDVNGAFTHPAVMANLIYGTLIQGKQSLNAQQEESLGELATRMLEQDRARLSGYDQNTLGLRNLIEEAELKDRFFDGVREILSPEQKKVLWPGRITGLGTFDLFSSGVVWGAHARPVMHTTRQQLENKLLVQFVTHLGLDEQAKVSLVPLVQAWSQAMTDKFLAVPASPLLKLGVAPSERVRAAAHNQLELSHAILAQVPMSDDQRQKLRENTLVYVPFAAQ